MSSAFGRRANNVGRFEGFIGSLTSPHGYIWCQQFRDDVILPECLFANLKLGQWISFECALMKQRDRFTNRHWITAPPIVINAKSETRVVANVPELHVECVLTDRLTADSCPILIHRVVGPVVDLHGYFNPSDIPDTKHSLWIVRHHRANHMARWKISIEQKRPIQLPSFLSCGDQITFGSAGTASGRGAGGGPIAEQHWPARRRKRLSRFTQERRPASSNGDAISGSVASGSKVSSINKEQPKRPASSSVGMTVYDDDVDDGGKYTDDEEEEEDDEDESSSPPSEAEEAVESEGEGLKTVPTSAGSQTQATQTTCVSSDTGVTVTMPQRIASRQPSGGSRCLSVASTVSSAAEELCELAASSSIASFSASYQSPDISLDTSIDDAATLNEKRQKEYHHMSMTELMELLMSDDSVRAAVRKFDVHTFVAITNMILCD